ncbi:4Fe-4S dicluster domain-containing protein [Campylobacter concisus]|jgi:selenate reductase subunit beta (selenate reductaseiron-sulfur subunit)|uniref:4Fe-4S dicluster domain-containing protein n=1 Tax=Campylobacter concisus TaxID=199 RepID=UPI003D1A7006
MQQTLNSRRSFIAAAGLFFATTALKAAPKDFSDSNVRYGMAIDLTRCVGCQSCTMSCMLENDVQPGAFRTIVSEYEARDKSGKMAVIASLPRLCNHCNNPACISVCPTGASHQRSNGIVKIDTKECIGCALCVEACPYHARYLSLHTYKADKCTFCDHRLRAGLQPACVESCVGGSRIIGDLNDPNSNIRKFLATHETMVIDSPKNTNPQVFYHGVSEILAKNNKKLELDNGYKKVISWSEEIAQ